MMDVMLRAVRRLTPGLMLAGLCLLGCGSESAEESMSHGSAVTALTAAEFPRGRQQAASARLDTNTNMRLGLGPCADCSPWRVMGTDTARSEALDVMRSMSGAGLPLPGFAPGDGASDETYAIRPKFGALIPEVPILLGQANGLFEAPPREVERGGGPIGFGPCADCVQIFVKQGDVMPDIREVHGVSRVEVRVTGFANGERPLRVDWPATHPAWHPSSGALLRIDLPLRLFKEFLVWQITTVAAEVEVTLGDDTQMWVSFQAGVHRTEVHRGGAGPAPAVLDGERIERSRVDRPGAGFSGR